ncbi:NfeD family protein [Paraurantiacibacter namhicola]|uniref:Inner membrane protein YbbJ n=1 Tax=Paraurantiacibacter namhicola TaxID=645517 RepID=A0A1C7D579_9SPHN|nr:NfeD family protein [Paraurantiacibacter namhicola]ANU06481.1 Inner membrane protein YbbJ [Paraurantiacibacter namhicola]
MDWEGIDAHWLWLTLGVVLAALEMLVPGVYLIWLAVAALITGVLTYGLDLSPAMQVIDFVFLSLIIAFSAKRFLKERPIVSSDPLMNKRTGRMVGQTAVVADAIEDGEGRVLQGDSVWPARGQDCPSGTKVRITGSDGAVLLVEPLNLLTDESTQPATESDAEPEPPAKD